MPNGSNPNLTCRAYFVQLFEDVPLREPGLSRHLEMGLLVQGEVARQIEDFWIYALEIELFIPVV